MSKIIYEPHPVTPERKKELREQGYTIIDAQFDPDPKPAKPELTEEEKAAAEEAKKQAAAKAAAKAAEKAAKKTEKK
ncbi:hypothetical protein [Dyadobacter sp. CY356]|uniref:hypothetical protein n=1 Tax=Dyadobacter sp. CY356 TaxID=2906442 RepID=UPI001F383F0C|nr:hypothetical protein [Dyadobacter sp. CY356]MCF0055519.1 hypothetical protein [Dyadobacter sp. CY356]